MPFAALEQELNKRRAAGLFRRRRLLESPQGAHVTVDGAPRLSFCSNDYLGLANHPRLIAAWQEAARIYGIGAGASHLVSGHCALHHALEDKLAAFVGRPAALLFSTGYHANLGAVQALVSRGDTVFADRLNHASLNDAMLLSRAEIKRYRHNDIVQLEQLLKQPARGKRLVVTDAVFSMDGDVAPLDALVALCERYDAWLLADDAHGFGVLGPEGRGSLAHINSPRIIYMATLGKAAGVAGAFVAGEAVVIETLVQQARSYIYTTASPPAQAAAVLAALDLICEEEWRRERLNVLISQLRAGLKNLPWQLMESATPIQPLVVGGNAAAVAISQGLYARGFWVPAIRPPTVPEGTARLRISLSAAHDAADIDQLIGALHELAR